MDKNSRIFLTFNESGKYITKRGEYSVAKLSGGNVTTPSKTLKHPEYADCSRKVVLDYSFIEKALEIPESPKRNSGDYHRWLRSDLGKLWSDWKKLSDEQKIKRHIEIYVKDMTGMLNPEEGDDYTFDVVMDKNDENDE